MGAAYGGDKLHAAGLIGNNHMGAILGVGAGGALGAGAGGLGGYALAQALQGDEEDLSLHMPRAQLKGVDIPPHHRFRFMLPWAHVRAARLWCAFRRSWLPLRPV